MRTGSESQVSATGWTVRHAAFWIVIPLVLGVAFGIVVRRLELGASTETAEGDAKRAETPQAGVKPTAPERLRAMADKQAEPLLAKLKSTPNDPELLVKVGNIYYVTQNFQEACTYFKRSLDIKDDATLRTELGRAYFYAGAPDNAIAEFEKVLKSDPDNANAMFNLGMVKWQSKFDVDGALAAWKGILKKYPNHPRRAEVEQLIAQANQHRNVKQ